MLIHKETKTQLQPEKTMHPRSLSSSLRYYKAMQEKATIAEVPPRSFGEPKRYLEDAESDHDGYEAVVVDTDLGLD